MPGPSCIRHAYSGLWSRPYSIQHNHLQVEGNCSSANEKPR